MSAPSASSRDVTQPDRNASGERRFWRSIEELEQSPEFLERLRLEFPEAVDQWIVQSESTDPAEAEAAGLSRRGFLTVMGAGLALLGLNGCSTRQPDQKIVPYVNQPEFAVPGRPLFFATALNINGYGCGVLVEQHEGRPTKIEGNPQHPASQGATSVLMQASILNMYDPDRSKVVVNRGAVSTWDKFVAKINAELEKKAALRGRGLRILTQPTTSPTFAAQMASLLKKYPDARWHQYSPTDRVNVRNGTRQAFGQPQNVVYHFDKAEVILALDSDFLVDEPGSVAYARQFIDGRRVRKDRKEMNRLYAIESTNTITGAMADHRLPLAPADIAATATALAHQLGVASAGNAAAPAGVSEHWLKAVADDLKCAGKGALVIAGEYQPASVHALCHAINASLGAIGNTVTITDPVQDQPIDSIESLRELVTDINAGNVDLLVMIGGNPVYNAPADLKFAEAMDKLANTGLTVHMGPYEDETSFVSHWHLPQTHELEEWSDLRAYDGTVTIGQPLIAPLYEGRSAYELLAMLLGEGTRSSYDLIRSTWSGQHGSGDFEKFWEQSLHDGVVANSTLAPKNLTVTSKPPAEADGSNNNQTQPPASAGGLKVVFRADPSVDDGSWANNAWLQELPKPITTHTWDNVVLMSFKTAKRLGLEKESAVELNLRGRKVARAGVLPMPGLPDDVVTLHLGYGRGRAGRIGTNLGFNAYLLRTTDAMWFGSGLEIKKLSGKYELAIAQEHQLMEGRDLYRVQDIEEYRAGRLEKGEHDGDPRKTPLNLYPGWDYSKGNQWGMVVDNNACIGCNACVIGCQSENNIPTVGKEQVIKGREMHWLRIDTYFSSQGKTFRDEIVENPETYFEPVACMHCENAPCEVVCPVGATVHDAEGTNNMVYNRCVGTRYCSNNCPYKVRHFNWLEFNGTLPEVLRMQKNPDVTIRNRGVMEKCSYCIQRVSHARIEAKKQDRPIRDGEVLTACQQACPTQAITFGNILDKNAAVTKLREEPANFTLLAELNTFPRTSYLGRFRNPNPALGSAGPKKHGADAEHV